jgi:hypothetical protein
MFIAGLFGGALIGVIISRMYGLIDPRNLRYCSIEEFISRYNLHETLTVFTRELKREFGSECVDSLEVKRGKILIKISHPTTGSSYSFKLQNIYENLQRNCPQKVVGGLRLITLENIWTQ